MTNLKMSDMALRTIEINFNSVVSNTAKFNTFYSVLTDSTILYRAFIRNFAIYLLNNLLSKNIWKTVNEY